MLTTDWNTVSSKKIQRIVLGKAKRKHQVVHNAFNFK